MRPNPSITVYTNQIVVKLIPHIRREVEALVQEPMLAGRQGCIVCLHFVGIYTAVEEAQRRFQVADKQRWLVWKSHGSIVEEG